MLSPMLVDPPAGIDRDAWECSRHPNEDELNRQAAEAAPPVNPQQLLAAAGMAKRERASLEKRLADATKRAEDLQKELEAAKEKECECYPASLNAQVPTVVSLPCSAENPLDGAIAKAGPFLAGTTAIVESKREF